MKLKTIEPLIVLELDTGEREFTDLEEFGEWAQNERQAFAWLVELSRQDGNAAQAWTIFNNWLTRINIFPNQYEQHKFSYRTSTFRPSASGFIKDDGIGGFHELFARSIQK